MPGRWPEAIWDLSGAMGKIRSAEAVSAYIGASLHKVELAFGEGIDRPDEGFIPYTSANTALTSQIEKFFSSRNRWRHIDISTLQHEFIDEYWAVFHYVGWRGTYSLTPLLIKLAYEGYQSGDEVCATVEGIFCKFPKSSDDKSLSFLDWMAMYDRVQISCILDMAVLIAEDPLRLYPSGYREGLRWWTKYLVDGPLASYRW